MHEVYSPPGETPEPANNGDIEMRPERPHSFLEDQQHYNWDPPADMPELQESDEIEAIVQAAQKAGFVTFDELSQVFVQIELSEDGREYVLAELDKRGIEILESSELDAGKDTAKEPEPKLKEEQPVAEPNALNMATMLSRSKALGLLTAHQEKVLSYRIQQGDGAAKEKMIAHNLRLVASISNKWIGLGVSQEDLFQEGIIGLVRATELFDPDRGYKFSTYATWWIKQAVSRSIDNKGRTIRVPVHVLERNRKMRKTQRDHFLETGQTLEVEEIAAVLDMKPEEAQEAWNFPEAKSTLNKPVGDDGDGEFGDLLSPDDPSDDEFIESASDSHRRQVLRDSLDILDTREREILQMRYGFYGQDYTLEKIGRELNLTRETIRTVEATALAKLAQAGELQEVVVDEFFQAIPEKEETMLDKMNKIPVSILVDKNKAQDGLRELSFKQYRVVSLLAKGLNYRDIGKALDMNPATAKGMGSSKRGTGIYKILDTATKYEAVKKFNRIMARIPEEE